MKDKVALRAHFRKLLRENSSQSKDQAQSPRGLGVTRNLTRFLNQSTGTWGSYLPLPEEADPRPAIAASPHIRWVCPKVDGDHLRFFKFDSSLEFSLNQWGVAEPQIDEQTEVQVSELTGVLVPGLAFDSKGGRLGRGKGYFDRLLGEQTVTKVGVAYGFQVIDEPLPREPHDIAMDMVITDEAVFGRGLTSTKMADDI